MLKDTQLLTMRVPMSQYSSRSHVSQSSGWALSAWALSPEPGPPGGVPLLAGRLAPSEDSVRANLGVELRWAVAESMSLTS